MSDEAVKKETDDQAASSETRAGEPTPVGETPEPVVDWEAQAHEYLNDLKRIQADFENYKKRQASQQQALSGYLIESLVLDLVPVLDNFRSAAQHVPEAERESPWVTGIQYIEKQLEQVIEEHGVKTIAPKEGERFDPSVHEAVGSGDPESEKPDETGIEEPSIAKVIQNGYRIGERVIRPAKVTVQESPGSADRKQVNQ